MSRVTTATRVAARPTLVLAAVVAIALSLAYLIRPAFAVVTYQVPLQESQQGSDSTTFQEEQDCGDYTSGVVWHFVLNQYDGSDTAHLVAMFQSAGTLEADASKVTPGTQHFYLNTPTDDILNDAYAEVLSDPGDANLVLSHVCHLPEESQSPSPSESVQESVQESVAESVPESIAESVPESVQESVQESVAESVPESIAESVPESIAESVPESVQESVQESVAESVPESVPASVEESVAGATGTPEASLPNGAMGQGDGSSPLPTVLFSLILLISLGTLAYVNVRTVRNRS